MSAIPFPRVGGSFTLAELEAKAHELHERYKTAEAGDGVGVPAGETPAPSKPAAEQGSAD